MALSDDQRRLLKLLAKQDEAYEAIAAATGADVEELKAKAAGAIEELEKDARGEGARAAGARAAGPVAAGDPPPPPVAEASSGEVPPTAPPAAEGSPQGRVRESPQSQVRSSVRLPGNRRFAELIGGAVVVLLLILFATGAIDIAGGDSDEGDGGGAPAALSDELPASDSKRATQAVLREVDGSGASGRALFGRLGKQVALVVAARGLEPSPQGSSYAISLVRSPQERIPIAATRVNRSGTISGQFQLPVTVLGALASGYDEMEVSLVANRELEAALREVRGREKPPRFEGETVLRGPIDGPVVVGGEDGSGG